ncbi:MAG: hypothetical protein AAF939_10375 [Planctomycetota bacterium]
MSNSIVAQIPKNLLFRYRIPCYSKELKSTSKFSLDLEYTLPHFGMFESQRKFADVRIAWTPKGLALEVIVEQKKNSLWCKESQLLESDGIQIWVDTRNTHNVHRASKFCHWFLILPSGGGGRGDKPIASMLKINRSRDDSPTINRAKPEVASKLKKSGYQMSVFIPSECLHGWNTDDHRHLGFNYLVTDRELGYQSLAIGPQLPIGEDPSLWQTLYLVD